MCEEADDVEDEGEGPPFLFEDRLDYMSDVLYPLYFEYLRGGREQA